MVRKLKLRVGCGKSFRAIIEDCKNSAKRTKWLFQLLMGLLIAILPIFIRSGVSLFTLFNYENSFFFAFIKYCTRILFTSFSSGTFVLMSTMLMSVHRKDQRLHACIPRIDNLHANPSRGEGKGSHNPKYTSCIHERDIRTLSAYTAQGRTNPRP